MNDPLSYACLLLACSLFHFTKNMAPCRQCIRVLWFGEIASTAFLICFFDHLPISRSLVVRKVLYQLKAMAKDIGSTRHTDTNQSILGWSIQRRELYMGCEWMEKLGGFLLSVIRL